MYEEKDFLIRQIELLAKGLGKFMGLEQIKEIIGIKEDQHSLVTDEELQSIITAAKLEVIIENSRFTVESVASEAGISHNRLNRIITHQTTASKKEITQLNKFIVQHSKFLSD